MSSRGAIEARLAAGWHPTDKLKEVSDETLRALVDQGLTLGEIAAQTGVSHSAVRMRVRGLGLVAPAVAPFQLKATDAEILSLREAGLWASQIAARTGMTTEAVRWRFRALRKRGVSVPPVRGPRPNPWRRASNGQIVAGVKLGLKQRDIAAQVGLSINSLEWRLRSLRRRGLLPTASRPAPLAVTGTPRGQRG